jgi:hypothetical protein
MRRLPAEALAKAGNFRGQHKGADDPCKIVAVGALPTVSTSLRSPKPASFGRQAKSEGCPP